MPDDKPIAGVDLEAEQVIEEEAEKPVKVKGKKIRPMFMIFGGILVTEALVMFMIFGQVNGGNPEENQAHADTQMPSAMLNMQSLEELGNSGVFTVGDVTILEPSNDQAGQYTKTTIVGLSVGIGMKTFAQLQEIFAANPDAEALFRGDLHLKVHEFMERRGGESVALDPRRPMIEALVDFLNEQHSEVGLVFTRVKIEEVKRR